MDPQTRPPEHDDEASQPVTVATIASGAHHRDELLHGRRICRVAVSLFTRRTAGMNPRHGRRRPPTTGGIEQQLGHDPSSA
jgi:hypothetical protein